MGQKKEVIKEMEGYLIVKYYANTLYTNNDEKNGYAYYGDIYTAKEELVREHPKAEILEGFGLIHAEKNYHPDDAPDWFDTVEEVEDYIKNNE